MVSQKKLDALLVKMNGRFHMGAIDEKRERVIHTQNISFGERAMINFMNHQPVLNDSSWPTVDKCIMRRK